MITITEQPTQEAGRCQGCLNTPDHLKGKVWVILAERASNFGLNVTIELRLCTKCLDELREKIEQIIPF